MVVHGGTCEDRQRNLNSSRNQVASSKSLRSGCKLIYPEDTHASESNMNPNQQMAVGHKINVLLRSS